MGEQRSWFERYGGHLVLVVVAILLFIGSRATAFNALFSTRATPEAEPAAVIEQPAGESPPPTPVAGAQPLFNLNDVPLLTNSSLAPAPIPITFRPKLPEHNFQKYVVERNDTPNAIAEKFGIKPETLLGGNPFLSEESNLLQTGVELIILPADGVLYTVREGDTLEGLSAEYGVPIEEIIAYAPNNLEFPYRLYPDTQILIPGAIAKVFVWTAPQLPARSSGGGGVAALIVGTGTFVRPVGGGRVTQWYWYGHPGVDIALAEGSSVVASDTGTVTYAGWNVYGYGNLIVINHGNGFETYYGHLSGINVYPGQIVYQGNYIGATGNTGRSSGPHIHFEIRQNNYQDDPCWYVSC